MGDKAQIWAIQFESLQAVKHFFCGYSIAIQECSLANSCFLVTLQWRTARANIRTQEQPAKKGINRITLFSTLDPCNRCMPCALDVPVSLPIFLRRHFMLLGYSHSSIELPYDIVEKQISCWGSLKFKVGLQDEILHYINHFSVELLVERLADAIQTAGQVSVHNTG